MLTQVGDAIDPHHWFNDTTYMHMYICIHILLRKKSTTFNSCINFKMHPGVWKLMQMEKKCLSYTYRCLVNFLRGDHSWFPEVIRRKREWRLMHRKRALKASQCVIFQHKTERSLGKGMMSRPLLGPQHLAGCPAPRVPWKFSVVLEIRRPPWPLPGPTPALTVSPLPRLWQASHEIMHLKALVKSSSQQTDGSAFGFSPCAPLLPYFCLLRSLQQKFSSADKLPRAFPKTSSFCEKMSWLTFLPWKNTRYSSWCKGCGPESGLQRPPTASAGKGQQPAPQEAPPPSLLPGQAMPHSGVRVGFLSPSWAYVTCLLSEVCAHWEGIQGPSSLA